MMHARDKRPDPGGGRIIGIACQTKADQHDDKARLGDEKAQVRPDRLWCKGLRHGATLGFGDRQPQQRGKRDARQTAEKKAVRQP